MISVLLFVSPFLYTRSSVENLRPSAREERIVLDLFLFSLRGLINLGRWFFLTDAGQLNLSPFTFLPPADS